MQQKSAMQQGWDFASSIMGADIAARAGQGYVSAVEKVISELENSINNHDFKNNRNFQGYVFEEWEAATFNIDAVAADSTTRAEVLHKLERNTVDIRLNTGEEYSAKSYKTAAKTANEQAKLNPDSGRASYRNQERLVPSD